MNTDNILCKCGMLEEEFKHATLDFNYCELHTTERTCINTLNSYNAKQIIRKYKDRLKVKSIHTPLIAKKAICIQHLLNEALYTHYILPYLELAQFCSELYNENEITVILHSNSDAEFIINDVHYTTYLAERINNILERYPNVVLCVENSMPLRLDKNSACLVGEFGYEVINLVKSLRTYIKSDRLKLTFDNCHFTGNQRLFKEMNLNKNNITYPELDLETYFKKTLLGNEQLIEVVHLAKAIDLALTPDTHGIHFDKHDQEDIIELSKLLNLINTYCPNARIVLENIEDNYNTRRLNAMKTIDCIKHVQEVY